MTLNKTQTLTAALACLIAALAATYVFVGRQKPLSLSFLSGSPADTAALAATSNTLTNAAGARERVQAARWIGQQSTDVDAAVVDSLAKALTTDPDPTVRAAAAAAFGDIAKRGNRDSAAPVRQESPLIEALSSAYAAESNASVRRCIVEAAADFNHAQAATLIERAMVDIDPGVREAAQAAKQKFDRRRLSLTAG